MGFPVERTRYRLTFEQEHLAGLEVEVAAMTVRETWAYNDAIAQAGNDLGAVTRIMIETVARQLASWNLEKAPGEPWPLTLEGFLDLDDSLVSPILTGWLQAIRPSRQAADPTEPPPEGMDIPMQPLTASDENASEPAG